MLPYTLRHYTTFASKIVIHDSFSTDRTREIAKSFGVDIQDWDTGNEFNDKMSMQLKNTAWLTSDADWVIMADADELMYFPFGAKETLAAYDRHGIAIVKPYGFEMVSDTFPTGDGQIYDEIKMGARDDKWYAKPILFSPQRVGSISFEAGAHGCTATLRNGVPVSNPITPTSPSTYLLHFHQLGTIEELGKAYDLRRSRLSALNVKQNWGWLGEGIVHARDKRAYIMARVERVVA
jgi:hypothetical protein